MSLTKIFNTYSNPANGKYVWFGVEEAESVFRLETISWKELLLLLEAQAVHLPTPKNHFTHNISIDSDVPIVTTGKGPIHFVWRYNAQDEWEDEMMAVHWKVYGFFSQIPAHKQKEIQPCPKCFCDMVLMAEL